MQGIKIGKNLTRTVIASLMSVVLLIGIVNASVIKRQLDQWKLLPQPERLTELYYENHTKLPTQYTAGTPQTYTFTVHNLEYATKTYSYEVAQTPESSADNPSLSNNSKVLASGSYTLAHDAYRSTPITITPIELGPRTQIVTTLKNKGESIHYWVTNTLPPTTVPPEGA